MTATITHCEEKEVIAWSGCARFPMAVIDVSEDIQYLRPTSERLKE